MLIMFRIILSINLKIGEMAEWSIALPWKGSVGATLPWVRIPLSPPVFRCNLKQ